MENRNYLVYLNTKDILPHPKNPRDAGLGGAEALSELANSIRENGIMQNLTVIPVGSLPGERLGELKIRMEDIDKFMVVIGHRRLAAAKLAGLDTVPCVIVSMSYEEQLATMMTENLQRSDLTPIEQAAGLRQLSMDLGLSAEEISRRTGISATTVRRRLKMAEMDPAKLREAAKGKQISLGDMERLGEIEDLTERENVLKHLGTHNFDYYLSCALREQKTAKVKAEWTEVMQALGIQLVPSDQKYSGGWVKVDSIQFNKKVTGDWVFGLRDVGKIEPGDEIGYLFDTYPDALVIYKKRVLTDKEQQEKDADAAHRAEYEERKETVSKLEAAFDNAAELRKTFIADYSEKNAKARLSVIAKAAVKWMTGDGVLGVCMDTLLPYIGDWEDDADMPAILAQVEKRPCATLLAIVYDGMDYDAGQTYPCHTWDYIGEKTYCMGEYDQNEAYGALADIYNFLEELGYEMSDAERALMDGSSPLYWENRGEAKAETTDGQPGTPVATEDAETDTEMTRFEALKALTREQLAKYLAAFDKGRNPDGTTEILDMIPECDSIEAFVHKFGDWFCCDIPCPVNENGEDESCEVCIDRWLNERKKWGFKALMKDVEGS